MKFSKTRTTDYRPPGAGGNPPLERNARPGAAAWDNYAARQAAEARNHDVWLEGLSVATLIAIATDLSKRVGGNSRDPEQRFIMGRKAAVLRKLSRMPRP